MLEPEIKVTKINNRWHARLFHRHRIFNEMACADKRDIGFICHEMLRWFDKLGGVSKLAYSSRARWPKHTMRPFGKIWYKNKLDEEKARLHNG